MMYKVVKHFVDLQDNNREYFVGDVFPHKSSKVTQARIDQLAGNKNKQGVPRHEEIFRRIQKIHHPRQRG